MSRVRRYSPPCITAAERKRDSAQPKAKEGWLHRQENVAKLPKPMQTGWFSLPCHRKTTPSSRSAEASRYLFDRSATPPCGDARRGMAIFQFVHTFIDRPYNYA